MLLLGPIPTIAAVGRRLCRVLPLLTTAGGRYAGSVALPQLRAALGHTQFARDIAPVQPLAEWAQRGQALGRADGLRFIEQRLALRRGLLSRTKTLGYFHA
jgi:hypothetical protein